MEDCLFCKIISGDIPSTKVYEDEYVYAFLDIAPQAPFHAVFVPKIHVKSPAFIDGENSLYVAKIFEAIAKVAKSENLEKGFRVVANCGEDIELIEVAENRKRLPLNPPRRKPRKPQNTRLRTTGMFP